MPEHGRRLAASVVRLADAWGVAPAQVAFCFALAHPRLASVLFGVLWNAFGATVAFGTGSALALIATVLLFVLVRR